MSEILVADRLLDSFGKVLNDTKSVEFARILAEMYRDEPLFLIFVCLRFLKQTSEPIDDLSDTIDDLTSRIASEQELALRYECPACEQKFLSDETLKVLDCGHLCHESCLRRRFLDTKACGACLESANRQFRTDIVNVFWSTVQSSESTVLCRIFRRILRKEMPEYDSLFCTETLPVFAVDRLEGGKYLESECSICFLDYRPEDTVTKLPCKHVYHSECAVRWFRKKTTCPTCRANVPNYETLGKM